MGEYLFTGKGILCGAGLLSSVPVKRKDPNGEFNTAKLDGKTIVAVNGCVTVPMAGEYKIEWNEDVGCCGDTQSPAFEFTESTGGESDSSDVIAGLEDINQSVDDSEIANDEDREIIKTALTDIETAIVNESGDVEIAIEQLEVFLQEIDDNTDGIEAALAALIALQVTLNGQHTIASGTGNIPAGLHSVGITNTSGTTIIAGSYTLGSGASISLTGQEHGVNGILPAITPVGGTWEWISMDKL